jgi:hypothetical protein
MSVQTSFRLQSLEICCTDTFRLAQAIEVAELLRLAGDYYHYRHVELRCHPKGASTAAIRVLRRAISDANDRGVQVRLSATERLRKSLERSQSPRPSRRMIGFCVGKQVLKTTRSIR